MDLVADDARSLERQLGAGDRDRLDETKLAQLAIVESEIVRAWGDFLRDLEHTEDHDTSLLDHTAVLLTSNLGNASGHDNRNLPALLAGGSFRHGQHSSARVTIQR